MFSNGLDVGNTSTLMSANGHSIRYEILVTKSEIVKKK